jgi:hypothetical protein
MARTPVQFRVHQAHLTSQNAAIVQTCVPFVTINGPSYRLRGRTDILKDAASPDSNEPDQPEDAR